MISRGSVTYGNLPRPYGADSRRFPGRFRRVSRRPHPTYSSTAPAPITSTAKLPQALDSRDDTFGYERGCVISRAVPHNSFVFNGTVPSRIAAVSPLLSMLVPLGTRKSMILKAWVETCKSFVIIGKGVSPKGTHGAGWEAKDASRTRKKFYK
jgi:hypothetical protein